MKIITDKKSTVLLVFCLMMASSAVFAGSAEDANKSNNPLNPEPGLNFQNYYSPTLHNSSAHTNDFMMRGVLPIMPGETVPVPQIVRVSLPVSTRHNPHGGYGTGLGDMSIFDMFLFGNKALNLEFGVGPMLTIPTATEKYLGQGKWQGGFSAVALHNSPAGLMGGLLQWQHSFAGDGNRETTHSATFQPFLIHNLSDGWYLRSTGIWTFDIQNGNGYVPVGFGAGKTWRAGHNIFNLFLEPQVSVWHEGSGMPHWTVFGGLNITFGK